MPISWNQVPVTWVNEEMGGIDKTVDAGAYESRLGETKVKLLPLDPAAQHAAKFSLGGKRTRPTVKDVVAAQHPFHQQGGTEDEWQPLVVWQKGPHPYRLHGPSAKRRFWRGAWCCARWWQPQWQSSIAPSSFCCYFLLRQWWRGWRRGRRRGRLRVNLHEDSGPFWSYQVLNANLHMTLHCWAVLRCKKSCKGNIVDAYLLNSA